MVLDFLREVGIDLSPRNKLSTKFDPGNYSGKHE